VKTKLTATAQDWGRGGNDLVAGSTGPDLDYGAGRLDAYAALASAGASIGSPPPVPEHKHFEGTLTSGAKVEYKLNITDTSFPIAATMIMPTVTVGSTYSPDFNVSLFNPSGVQVASSTTRRRQDDLGYAPTVTGTYTLRVSSSSGAGAFFVDVSAGTGTPPPPVPDTTPPTISSISPTNGATGIGSSTTVSVTFSEAMDQTSAQAAFSLVNSGTLAAVAGSFSWSGNTMTFTPSSLLLGGVTYAAKVAGGAGGAKDLAGNALTADANWSFTTALITTRTASPSSTTVLAGSVRSGTVANLAVEDGVFYALNSSTASLSTYWYGSFTGLPSSLPNLKVVYSGKNSITCSQTVAIYKWSTAAWVQLDSRSVGSTVVKVTLTPPESSSVYLNAGELRVRIRCVAFTSFYQSADLLQITYDG
jgi:hypothetical protein